MVNPRPFLPRKTWKNITTVVNKTNVDSTSKNIFRTPGFLVKMTLPVNKNIFFGPDIGINRSCIFNKAYVDNDGVQLAKKPCTLIRLLQIPNLDTLLTRMLFLMPVLDTHVS